MPNEIWNEASCPEAAVSVSTPWSSSTAKAMPKSPAMMVSTMLSTMICVRMFEGLAPMARRMPISLVRSRTVTIMMLLTPIAPDSRVPMPMSHTRISMPRNRLSTMRNMTSMLNEKRACVSVGEMRWAFLMMWSTWG